MAEIPALPAEPLETVRLGDDGQIDRASDAFLLEGEDTLETCQVYKAFCKLGHRAEVVLLECLLPFPTVLPYHIGSTLLEVVLQVLGLNTGSISVKLVIRDFLRRMETNGQAPLEFTVSPGLPLLAHTVKKCLYHIILSVWSDCHRPLVADFYDILVQYVVVNPPVNSFIHCSSYQRWVFLIASVSRENQNGT